MFDSKLVASGTSGQTHLLLVYARYNFLRQPYKAIKSMILFYSLALP